MPRQKTRDWGDGASAAQTFGKRRLRSPAAAVTTLQGTRVRSPGHLLCDTRARGTPGLPQARPWARLQLGARRGLPEPPLRPQLPRGAAEGGSAANGGAQWGCLRPQRPVLALEAQPSGPLRQEAHLGVTRPLIEFPGRPNLALAGGSLGADRVREDTGPRIAGSSSFQNR